MLKKTFDGQWADLFIVSDVEFTTDAEVYAQGADTAVAGVRVLVSEAKGEKCGRCWKHHLEVGKNAAFADLCPRCAAVVAKIPDLA